MEKHNFGEHLVSAGEKVQLVNTVFDQVASKYDLMNDLMSFGLHRCWKRQFINMIGLHPGMKIMDMASGTCDIALRIAKKTRHFNPPIHLTMCDINSNMLEVGRDKMINHGFIHNTDWVTTDAADLSNFSDNEFDCYVITFGLRNVTHIPEALKEAARVLKSGAKFMCMEFSQIKQSELAKLYEKYADNIIPQMGSAIVGESEPYEYLVESIRKFPPPLQVNEMLKQAGFSRVSYTSFLAGMVTVHSAIV